MEKLMAIAAAALLTVSVEVSAADVVTVKWDKGGANRTVVAFDLTRRAVVWDTIPCRTGNFAEKTSGGILVGCDDSNVVMLDPATGNVLWRRDLAMQEPDVSKREKRPFREIQVNRFHGERPDGFFLSSSDEVYLLIGKKGEYLMRCDRDGCTASPKAHREESKK